MFLLLLLLVVSSGLAQSGEILLRGLAVYSGHDEGNFPALARAKVDENGRLLGSSPVITIQFDILADTVPDLKIRFFHCNRDWMVDDNLFVNDNNHNTSFYLDYRTSPGGVKGYSYRFTNSFPDREDAVRFEYSGNWIFMILDKKETTIAAGRFFVVDETRPTSVRVSNDYLTANPSPYNQIHKVVVRVKLDDEIDGARHTAVDIYQNRKVYAPYRIDTWDRDPYTFVEGHNTGERIFKISNIMPGNEYRVWDLANVTRYPNGSLVRNVNGADQLRLFWRTGADHNGEATRNSFTGINSDYLELIFRLDVTSTDYRSVTRDGKEIFLAGEFNFWNPQKEDALAYNDTDRSYVVKKVLSRGIYDYQYVTGMWDASRGRVVSQDWLAIEGNDWRTTNTYTAFVYYNDPRFGGFDRIVGMARGNSAQELPGSN